MAARAGCFAALGIICQLHLRDLGASRFQVALNSTLAWTAIMLWSRFWGDLSDRVLTRRRVMLVSAIGSTCMMLILLRSRSSIGILTGRFLTEVFGAGLAPAAMAWLSERGGAANRGSRMSVFTTSQSIGFMSGMLGGGALASSFSFHRAYAITIVFSLLTLLGVAFVSAEGGRASRPWVALRSALAGLLPTFSSVRKDDDLARHGLFYLYLGVMLRKAGVVGIYGLLMVFLQERHHLTAFASSGLSAINPATQIVFMPLFGRVADALSRKKVFLTGYALSALVPLSLMLSGSTWALGGTFFLLGLGFAVFMSGVTAYVGDVAPKEKQGELMGLIKVSQGIGGIGGPLIAGAVSTPTVGDYGGMFIVMSLMMFCGLMLTAFGPKE